MENPNSRRKEAIVTVPLLERHHFTPYQKGKKIMKQYTWTLVLLAACLVTSGVKADILDLLEADAIDTIVFQFGTVFDSGNPDASGNWMQHGNLVDHIWLVAAATEGGVKFTLQTDYAWSDGNEYLKIKDNRLYIWGAAGEIFERGSENVTAPGTGMEGGDGWKPAAFDVVPTDPTKWFTGKPPLEFTLLYAENADGIMYDWDAFKALADSDAFWFGGHFQNTEFGSVRLITGSLPEPPEGGEEAAVPEPATLALMSLGLAGIGAAARRRMKK